MDTLQQYKCPCCGGAIEFNTDAQKMKCPYCDTEFEMETLRSYDAILQEDLQEDMHWEDAAGGSWEQGEAEKLRLYCCNSCGGQIVGDDTTAATQCPFCGNPVVMMGQLAGDLKPDWVIPFKLDKQAAVEALKKHYAGKKLLPDAFKDQNHIEQVKGIYVPFWLYNARANAKMRYRATRIRRWSDSRYIYTQTSHYAVHRSGTLDFERVPVDGSSKMDDAMMESIEPYNYADAVDFQTAYLAGFFADKYDVDSAASQSRANDRIRKTTEQEFMRTVVGYHTVTPQSQGMTLSDSSAKYALCPVWILNTQWNGQKYTFAMNGQTGKMAGDLPMDKGKMYKWLFGVMGAVTAAAFALSYAVWWL